MAEMLPGPYEILELPNAQTVELLITGRELGDIIIHPRGQAGVTEKIIRVMRVHLAPGSKTVGPPYWDLTAGTLIAQLLPLIPPAPEKPVRVRILATGVAPAKRFTVTTF